MVDFEIFVEVTQFAFREGGDLFSVFLLGGLLGFFIGFAELHGNKGWC